MGYHLVGAKSQGNILAEMLTYWYLFICSILWQQYKFYPGFSPSLHNSFGVCLNTNHYFIYTLYVERKMSIVSNISCIEDVCSLVQKYERRNNIYTHTQGIISWSTRRNGSTEGALNAKNKLCYIIIITLLNTITVCKWTWLICKAIAREDREGKNGQEKHFFFCSSWCWFPTFSTISRTIWKMWKLTTLDIFNITSLSRLCPWWGKRVIIVKPNWES